MKKMTKHVVAFLLVVCLTLGMCSNGLVVLADSFTNASKTFRYVSLGASQTNGYGLQGYLPITVNNGQVPEDQLHNQK